MRGYDFVDPQLGKAILYGVYDVTANTGWVSVGLDHDTAEFAGETLRRWWRHMGALTYPKADALLITADGGGSNGSRCRLWKVTLQRLADEWRLPYPRVSLSSRHQQMEQNRAPPVQSHHHQLTRTSPDQSRNPCQSYRQHHHPPRVVYSGGTGPQPLSHRHCGERSATR